MTTVQMPLPDPFPIPLDEAVVTSTYVTHDRMPILYVSHDEDEDAECGGMWQFHCGNGDYDMEKIQLVSLRTILSLDPSVASLATLPINRGARRDHVGDTWRIEQEG